MEKTINEFEFNPATNSLKILQNGKCLYGLSGNYAEKKFMEILGSGNKVTLTPMDKDKERKTLVRRLRAAWIRQGVDKYRESILEAYGVTSTADLSISQLNELLNIYSIQKPINERVRKLRSRVMILLEKLGVYKNQNWSEVNDFLLNGRIAGKLLYQMNEAELNQLIKKLYAIAEKKAALNN